MDRRGHIGCGSGFTGSPPENERWQVTMLVKHADKLSPVVRAALK